MSMLEHGHGGEELTLVLQGAFKDKVGRFARGDIADLDEDTEHCPIIEEGETCICLYATEAPSHYKTFGRLLQPFLGFSSHLILPALDAGIFCVTEMAVSRRP